MHAFCNAVFTVHTIFRRPFVKRFALCYRTAACLFVYKVGELWPNGWVDQGELEVGHGSGHIVQKSRPSSNVKVKGQGHRGQKKRKNVAFCSGVVLCGAVLCQFYAGWKIIACCLVDSHNSEVGLICTDDNLTTM